jgi:hypothetical protein
MTATLIIEGFEPLRLTLPADVDLVGEVQVQLPPVHVKLVDLSLGGLVPDAPHIGLDAPMTDITIILPEPTTVGEIVNTLIASAGAWQALWLASQRALDNCGPILG